MKKRAVSIMALLCIFGASFGFTGCNSGSAVTGFFTPTALWITGLQGIQKPDFEYVGCEKIYRRIYGNIEREEFDRYAQEVLEFLQTKSDSMGVRGEIVYEGTPRIYAYEEVEEKLENFGGYTRDDEETVSAFYQFIYTSKSKCNGENCNWIHYVADHVSLRYYSSKTSTAEYNFTMEIRKVGESDKCVYHEHTLFGAGS